MLSITTGHKEKPVYGHSQVQKRVPGDEIPH